MRQSLKTIYQKYFPEIISAVLIGLAINTFLLVFSIYSSRKQRTEIFENQTAKIDSTNQMIKNATNLQEVLKKYKK